MRHLTSNVLAALSLAGLLGSAACSPTSEGERPATQPAAGELADGADATVTAGTVTGISDNHGNVYTSITPGQYATLGLVPGARVVVAFDKADAGVGVGVGAMTLPVAATYTDAPVGAPLAVLHREGLTFAVRDGNFSEQHGVKVGDGFRVVEVEAGE